MNGFIKNFADIFTFSRASGGGRINALGAFEWVAANQPRIDHNPINLAAGTGPQTISLPKDRVFAVTITGGGTVAITGAGVDLKYMGPSSGTIRTLPGTGNTDITFTPSGTVTAVHVREVRGPLIEEQRTNEITYSSDFTSAAWSKIASTVSPGFTGIDGSNGASKIVETTANSNHGIARASWVDHRNGSACASIFAKAAERTAFAMWLDDGSGKGITAKFDLVAQTATITRTDAKFSVMKCAIYPGPLGFFRCVLAVKNTDATGVGTWGQLRLYLDKAGGTSDGFGSVMYAGDGTSGLIIQAAQEEGADFETSYIPTTTAQVTRAADSQTETLSPWFNQSKGTVIWSGDVSGLSPGKWPGLFKIRNSSGSNIIGCYIQPTGSVQLRRDLAFAQVSVGSANLVTVGQKFKVAVSWDASNLYISLNGGAVATASHSGLGPDLATLEHGKFDDYLIGHKAGFKYQQKTTTGAALQALSA